METNLELQDITYQYDSGNKAQIVLRNLSYTFSEGTFYTILGPSGAGKTTLLSIAAGIDKPTSGKLIINKKVLNETMSLQSYRKSLSSIIFQAYNLIPYMTAVQNVYTAMGIQHSQMKDKRKRAIELLKEVGLTDKQINSPVLKLSGGQQQRVTIARALSGNAPFIFADEPTGNLDHGTSEHIIDLFRDLAHKKNKCVVMVTHDNHVASRSDVILNLKGKTLI
ncbi:putative ABC transporter ATP-binding protein [Listeria monocytogenes]|uniref:ABC transporter ATP-binding protein n=1 Tax=Listeria monocytogenes TaxID=1639 RepID=UPI000A179CC7|nr:ABC transporter ATP-binding protein [Listeria monocytogenes]ARJ92113.1 ABC transporter [Listeria monocytogenes]EAG2369478.1 ABC transporter ATP-binding protein [Listeria monocytogenes]EHP2973868.1 ABC transporter ATP-binding protein [Listeria monocytogenes]RLQ35306.1 putative ABC transporter ATP-binding protein [Listeria monocytogenes]